MGDIVPRNVLVKQGVKGAAGVGGGVVLLILNWISSLGGSLSLTGLIVGGVVSVAGLVIASSPEDRRAGYVALGAGLLTIVASLPLLGGVASWFMRIGGVGLILMGAWSLVKFFLNLRKRGR